MKTPAAYRSDFLSVLDDMVTAPLVLHERMFLHTSATKNNRNKRTFDRPALTS